MQMLAIILVLSLLIGLLGINSRLGFGQLLCQYSAHPDCRAVACDRIGQQKTVAQPARKGHCTNEHSHLHGAVA